MFDQARSPHSDDGTLPPVLAMLAQQLSQPLTAIMTLGDAGLRWLDRDTPDLGELKFVLQRLILDAQRASETAARLRALTTAPSEQRSVFELNALVAESLPRLESRLDQHGIDVELSLEDSDSPVCGHRPQMAQVIDQLLENAIGAMLGEATQQRPRRLRIRSRRIIDRQGARHTALEIADNGDASWTVRPSTGAAGKPGTQDTRLSLCRYVIHEHGGRLRVAIMPDSGASVTVVLPLAETVAPAPRRHEGGPQGPRPSRCRRASL